MKGKPLDGYISVRQAANILEVSKARVKQLIEMETIKPEYVDTTYIIKKDIIDSLKKEREKAAQSDKRYKA